MSDEPEESSSSGFRLSRRDFLQVSAASAVFAPTLLDKYSESLDDGPQGNESLSEETADLLPPPTERRAYFPLESELVSVRGLAPSSSGAEDGGSSWMDDQTISLRNLAAWRSNSDPVDAFNQDFPNSVRELITPQGEDIREDFVPIPEKTGWESWVGDYRNSEAKDVGTPDSVSDLVELAGRAAGHGKRFRAVGSGHSHSEAAAPEHLYTNMNGASGTLNQPWLKDDLDIDSDHLVRLGAGTILKTLNREILDDKDLALKNMGSFDGQTLAGAINTSTHGTGLGLKTFADSVRSVEIVCLPESQYHTGIPYARSLRIEPSEGGITDPTKFAADADKHGTALIQNDDLFHSVVVGYGCMGIVYAYTLEVRESYWLKEETELMDWNTLKEELSPKGDETKEEAVENFVTKDNTRHFHFLLNLPTDQVPSEFNDEIKSSHDHEGPNNPVCLIKRHKEVSSREEPRWWDRDLVPEGYDTRWPPERRKKPFRDIAKGTVKLHPLYYDIEHSKRLHNNFFDPERAETEGLARPKSPFVTGYQNRHMERTIWYIALRRLRDEKSNPPEPPRPTTTTEAAVPLQELVEAVDAIRNKVGNIEQEKKIDGKYDPEVDEQVSVFFPYPLGVRFTDASTHHLSPEYDRKSAMLEVPMPVNEGKTAGINVTRGNVSTPTLTQEETRELVSEPALEKIQDLLVNHHSGRPHMGKHNTVHIQSDNEKLRPQNMYPEYEKWLDAYRYLNKFGTFDGPFSANKTLPGSDD